MDMYYVSRYEELPSGPCPTVEFPTLEAARKYARRYYGGRRDTTLKGQWYEDGSTHVEAYYTNEYQSSGCWITTDD